MSLIYHNYKNDLIIAVDIETKDPLLITKGPGVYRKDGYICGVSLSNGELSEYYDINHPDTKHEDKEKNLNYIKDQLSGNNIKIFANGVYDLDWLINGYGIKVNGQYEDIQIAEPLLDEYKSSYSLNSLATQYIGEGKKKNDMQVWCDQHGIKLLSKQSPVQHLWKMPVDIVRYYAEEDTRLTWLVFQKQIEKLKEQGLLDIYRLEMKLFPLLLQMRRQGVRIDTEKLNSLKIKLTDLDAMLQREINILANKDVNINSGKDLEKLFKKFNVSFNYEKPTELMLSKGKSQGNPKFNKDALSSIKHPLANKILELRHIKTLLSLFVNQYPEFIINGRIHAQFNQLKSDDYGTVSGRFSSSNCNLQQVSGKEEEKYIKSNNELLNGKVIRQLFIPEENCDWLKFDYSQIEYRLIAHYALGEGSDSIRQRYNNDPHTDYHTELGILTGISDRKTVKTLNFGSAYGMGVKKMAETYNWNLEEAEEVYNLYHSRVPFVKETMNRVGLKAKKVGYIKTILNRSARLLNKDKAYVMFNRLIQGSAADLIKKAMVDAYDAGIYNILYPHLTVHDELDQSMPKTKEGYEAAKELKCIMENCIKLKVPIIAECEVGPNWGKLNKVKNLEELK